MQENKGPGGESSPVSVPEARGQRLAERFFDALASASMAVLFAYVLLVIANVVGRYVFSMPIHIVSDLGEILVPVSLVLTFSVAAYQGTHLAIRFLGSWFGEHGTKWLNVFGTFLTVVLMALIAWKLVDYTTDLYSTGRTTVQFSIPIWPVWAFATIAFGLAAVGPLVGRGKSRDSNAR